ncbi:hypothetical protein SCHPADRAFT_838502 [Schizopora paradoxa]|uniref:Uncharacterized protein n=1 Tax=Schizopora paradoxa TaxID=27342 RepID=A0A0H2R2W0_9AGAM|nr:hypothetical protein SCHPADRAFT_838502 [Schizopora paradoxa]
MSSENHSTTSHVRTHRLSAKQERNLVDFVEEKFLEITRAYKKRSLPSTTLPTLKSYIEATHSLLPLILQIPPIDSQASLRIALLLRLTGEFLGAILGYVPDPDSLSLLLNWLDELDRGWLAVLRSQAWDPDERDGVDLEIPTFSTESNGNSPTSNTTSLSRTVSQTDRARLRSIFVTGTSNLEEWLEKGLVVEGADDLESALEKLGLQQAFDELFERTLGEMGYLAEDTEIHMDMTACR